MHVNPCDALDRTRQRTIVQRIERNLPKWVKGFLATSLLHASRDPKQDKMRPN